MRTNILYILFISFIFSQSSSLSLYGLGERINTYDSNALSLGGLRLFSSSQSDFVLSSPSSYYNNYHTNLSMSVSFNTVNAKAQNGSRNKLESNNFNHFSFGFPITKNQYFLLSLNPVFRSYIYMQEQNFTYIGADKSYIDTNGDGFNDPVKYRNSFNIYGGLSEIASSISSKINDDISLGFKIGKLFGTNSVEDTLSFYKVEFDQNGNVVDGLDLISYEPRKSKYNFSAMSYFLDMRFSVLDNNMLAFYYGQSSKLKIDKTYDNYNPISSSIDGYKDYGIGFKYNIYDNFGYILEFQKFDSFKLSYDSEIFIRPSLDMQSSNIGLFFIHNTFSKTNISCMKFNFGLYDKVYKIQNNINNAPTITDLGITLGFGVEYLNQNSFDVAFVFGKRYSEFSEFFNEKYFKLTLSLISNNDWFIREKE